MDYVREIEKNLGKKAEINFLPLQAGDVVKSHADVDPLVNDFGYAPKYSVKYELRILSNGIWITTLHQRISKARLAVIYLEDQLNLAE